ncbi:putative arginine--tRNA ligase mitochondrial [Fasciolopsis buskii]|uniref:Probable arginine--tRNA ligase, mitochondrial n=1 Tax=Fasciolopsis buskii TaxID=27845 RepID=A0A8E0RUG6_9TREM|nr:putative arginine--tRNA ligase mitochondrial [Fasciolopsis buski]
MVLQAVRYPHAIQYDVFIPYFPSRYFSSGNPTGSTASHCSSSPSPPAAECYRIHIPFGRVQGASTRRGKGVTLSDILDNSREVILHRMAKSPNTRFPDVSDPTLSETKRQEILDIADHLGVTCLVVEFLRQRRQKPVRLRSFLGNPVSNNSPDDLSLGANGGVDTTDLSGLGLQYCHARLCSAVVNSVWRNAMVLNCDDPSIQLLRLSSFLAARNVLAVCLRLLGIRPLRTI